MPNEAPPASPQATAPAGPLVLALRPKAAAKALGISPRLLWTLTNRHEIPYLRLGKCIVYPAEMLREWLTQRAKEGRGHDR